MYVKRPLNFKVLKEKNDHRLQKKKSDSFYINDDQSNSNVEPHSRNKTPGEIEIFARF